MYRGRFAPSPTGALHLGSLLAATASYLDARASGGQWFVRIEDIDPPREVPGAAAGILRTLEAFGLDWDGEVLYQSRRLDAYRDALSMLESRRLAYRCRCSRREAALAGPVYSGACREAGLTGEHFAVRVRVVSGNVTFHDLCQGTFTRDLSSECGDFVIHRADGWPAYQLAVTVDDAMQGITRVVRGSDLLDSTPRQIHLQRLLDLPTPEYLHVPILVDSAGYKLSKQTLAAPVEAADPAATLHRILRYLGQAPPPDLPGPAALTSWAVANWNPHAIPATLSTIF